MRVSTDPLSPTPRDTPLADMPLLDHHCHGVTTETLDRSAFEALITAIQTLPELQGRRFAVIADEAHSSQTGSTASLARSVRTVTFRLQAEHRYS